MGLALALLLGIAQAQAPAPSQPAPEPVRISVAIQSPDGRPVRNVQARDVEVREDGALQPILSFEPRSRGPRRVAIVLDEFHVNPSETLGVRRAAHWFVEEHLREGDEVSVLKPLDPLSRIHFTGDRGRLHDTIETFEGRKGNYTPRTTLEAETVGQSPALAEASRAQIVLSALRELATRIGGMRGRTAIVLVSEGFVRERGSAAARSLPGAEMVERFANRFDVPVYALCPAPSGESDAGREALRALAAQTGGTFRESADLADGFRAVGDDLDSGYVITYRPPHPADGRFHQIQVTLRRANMLARARAGYVAVQSVNTRATSRGTSLLSDRLLRRSPLVTVWAGVTRLTGTDGHVVVTWSSTPASSGRGRAVTAKLRATKLDGTVLFEGPLRPVDARSGPGERAEFDAPTGRVQLDMAIFGARGETLDTDARDLDVPAVGTRTLLLPPVLVSTRTAREFRDAAEAEHATPEPDRGFSRTERLLIRVPAYAAVDQPARVTARLLNRMGQQMRVLDIAPGSPAGVTQFDLPLAMLAPGDYILEFRAAGPAGTIEQRIGMRVTG